MKIIFLLVTLLLSNPFAFADTQQPLPELRDGEIPQQDGVYKMAVPSGLLEEGHTGWGERTFQDGKLNGIEKTYIDGKLFIEGNYKDNKLDGLVREFFANGQVATEFNYKEGLTHGWSKSYYENGTLKFQNEYDMGKMIGPMFSYSESGNIQYEMIFDNNGKPLSKKEYDRDGHLIRELNQEELLQEIRNRIDNKK